MVVVVTAGLATALHGSCDGKRAAECDHVAGEQRAARLHQRDLVVAVEHLDLHRVEGGAILEEHDQLRPLLGNRRARQNEHTLKVRTGTCNR